MWDEKKRRICYLVAGLIMLLICLTSVSSKAESEMSAVEYKDLISSKGISSRDETISPGVDYVTISNAEDLWAFKKIVIDRSKCRSVVFKQTKDILVNDYTFEWNAEDSTVDVYEGEKLQCKLDEYGKYTSDDQQTLQVWTKLMTTYNYNPNYSEFQGTYLGEGHVIRGDVFRGGFVAALGRKGSVRNVRFQQCLSFGERTGGASGIAAGWVTDYGSIEDCLVDDCISIGSVTGGIAGSVGTYNGKIQYCTVKNTVCHGRTEDTADPMDGEESRAGGIIGSGNINIYNCSTENGSVDGFYAGGIAGETYQIESCRNTAGIKGNYAGGIVGYTNGYENAEGEKPHIFDCQNLGEVSNLGYSDSEYIGGICGLPGGGGLQINRCLNQGKVSLSSKAQKATAGGIAGGPLKSQESASCINIINCLNRGEVSMDTVSGVAGGIMGSIIAPQCLIGNSANEGMLRSVHNIGQADSGEEEQDQKALSGILGGIVGQQCDTSGNIDTVEIQNKSDRVENCIQAGEIRCSENDVVGVLKGKSQNSALTYNYYTTTMAAVTVKAGAETENVSKTAISVIGEESDSSAVFQCYPITDTQYDGTEKDTLIDSEGTYAGETKVVDSLNRFLGREEKGYNDWFYQETSEKGIEAYPSMLSLKMSDVCGYYVHGEDPPFSPDPCTTESLNGETEVPTGSGIAISSNPYITESPNGETEVPMASGVSVVTSSPEVTKYLPTVHPYSPEPTATPTKAPSRWPTPTPVFTVLYSFEPSAEPTKSPAISAGIQTAGPTDTASDGKVTVETGKLLGVAAKQISVKKVRIRWRVTNENVNIRIMRGRKGDWIGETIAEVAAAKGSYLDKKAVDQAYWYNICVVNTEGSIVDSREVSLRLYAYSAPKVRVQKQKTPQGQKYLRISLIKKQNCYLECYRKKKSSYYKIMLRDAKLRKGHRSINISYGKGMKSVTCRFRIYRIVQGKKRYSQYTKAVKIHL